MRGLARDGRSPRTSREPPGLKSFRSLAHPFSPLLPTPSFLLFSFLLASIRSILVRSIRVLSPSLPFRPLREFPSSSLGNLRSLSLYWPESPRRWCSRAVRLEVVLPCTWIPIYAQIRDSSSPRKYLDAGVSRILLRAVRLRPPNHVPKETTTGLHVP